MCIVRGLDDARIFVETLTSANFHAILQCLTSH